MLKYVLFLVFISINYNYKNGSTHIIRSTQSIPMMNTVVYNNHYLNKTPLLSHTEDLLKKTDSCINIILGDKMRKHRFEIWQDYPDHINIFSNKDLQNIHAYSNKEYPRSILPNSYEHFTLFVLEYKSKDSAVHTYDKLKRDCGLNKEENKFKHFPHGHIKSGGMVFQIENLIFSLVETCRNTPNGGSWLEYENNFLKSLIENRQALIVLNADCGDMCYHEEKRMLIE